MAKSHCASRHAARACSRGRTKKMTTEPDEKIRLLSTYSKEKLSFLFNDLLLKRFMSGGVVGGGGDLLLSLTSSSHRRQQMR